MKNLLIVLGLLFSPLAASASDIIIDPATAKPIDTATGQIAPKDPTPVIPVTLPKKSLLKKLTKVASLPLWYAYKVGEPSLVSYSPNYAQPYNISTPGGIYPVVPLGNTVIFPNGFPQ